jgi:probable phosphoglycerate mutase
MSPRHIILVRHAESQHHVLGLTGGWTASHLTDHGLEQARLVAQRLRDELGLTPVDVYTSDLSRSRETAGVIAEAFAVTVTEDQRLRERNNGVAVDITLDEARRRFPGMYDRKWEVDFRPFEGAETAREFYDRVSGFIDSLPAGPAIPIVISHGGTMHCLVARWLGLPADVVVMTGFGSDTTGLTVLQTGKYGEHEVERLNDVTHLVGTKSAARLPGSVSG